VDRARRWTATTARAAQLAALLTACEGPPGPPGPRGPAGEGPDAALEASLDVPSEDAIPADTDAMDVGPDTPDAPSGAERGPEEGARVDPRALCQSCHPGLDVSSLNLVAIHSPESPRYLTNCLHCHQDLLSRSTLDGRYPEIHRRMLPYTGTWRGAARNADCVFCHARVDLAGQRSAAGLRRQVSVGPCVACHRDGRWDFYLP
jgi:hypothetical protein